MRPRTISSLVLGPLLLVFAQAQAQTDPLPSWTDGPARKAIIEFVQATTDKASPKFVAPEARIATFDQDGTQGLPDSKVGAFTQTLYDEAKRKGWAVISISTRT